MTFYSLYIDTTDHLVLGILDKNYEWIDLIETSERKGSKTLHSIILDVLLKNQLKLKDVNTIFQIAGPGSYTGMRLGDGFCQTLGWLGKKIISFYHFEIPGFLKVQNGFWFSKAFKGEIFIYYWNNGENESYLLDQNIFQSEWLNENRKGLPLFTHFKNDFEIPIIDDPSFPLRETGKMVREFSSALFSEVAHLEVMRPLYYYRPLELEFKVGQA